MHILIAGGTGMTGRALSSFLLSRGYRVTVLSRSDKFPSDPGRANLIEYPKENTANIIEYPKENTANIVEYPKENTANIIEYPKEDTANIIEYPKEDTANNIAYPKEEQANGIGYSKWDPAKGLMDEGVLNDVDVIIHVAGANVGDKRWTVKRKKEILDSRIQTTKTLYEAIHRNPGRLKTFIGASAIGWYGSDQASSVNASKKGQGSGQTSSSMKPFTEEMPATNDFLGTTVKTWEEELLKIEKLGIRLVIFRTGIVLSNEGGAYPEFLKPLKFGLATILGSGNQAISWIHIEDLCRMYLYAIENPLINGIYNAVAPSPVSNRNMICEIAAQKRKQFFIPIYVPSFILKLVLGEMSIEVLKSTTVSNEKIRRSGFQFLYPTIESAISSL